MESTEDDFVDAIQRLDENREVLEMFTHNCILSAEKFYIENYIDDIVTSLIGVEYNLRRLYFSNSNALQLLLEGVALR